MLSPVCMNYSISDMGEGEFSSAQRPGSLATKRALDLIGVTLAIIVTSPLWLVAFIGICLTSPGPIFFKAQRVGKGGEIFRMYKFRSMHVTPEGTGPAITAPGDTRIFPFGRFLRASKIDELPQAINILRGDISFVGPRPEDPGIVERHYDADLRETLTLTPGLTSEGTLYFLKQFETAVSTDDTEQSYAENILRPKLAHDMAYERKATMWTDLGLMLRTLWAVIVHLVRGGKS